MSRRSVLLLCLGACMAFAQAGMSSAPGASTETDSLVLEKVFEQLSRTHPALEAGRSALAARSAAAEQAGRGPNPELGVEVEDVAGSGAYGGMEEAQTTFQVGQTVEMGGKRASRLKFAEAEKKMADLELRGKRADLRAQARIRFMETLVAQRRLALAEEAVVLAQRLLGAVARRVQEGAASSADEIRSRLAVSEARLELRQDSLRLSSSRQKLALLLGEEASSLPPLRGGLDSLPPLPPDFGARTLAGSPAATLRAGSVGLAEARMAQQKSLAGPDIHVSAGVRHFAGPGDLALVGGVSLPLPIWNRNQGGKAEAGHELARAKAEEKAFLQDLRSDAADLDLALSQALDEAKTLRETLIPDAEKAAQVLEEGYRRGRFGVLDVLSAKGDLFRHRMRYLDAYLRYQQGLAQWEQLAGAGAAPEEE